MLKCFKTMVLLVLQLMKYCLREKSVLNYFNLKVNKIRANLSYLKYIQSWNNNITSTNPLKKSSIASQTNPVNNSGRKYVKDTFVVCYTQWKHFHLKTKLNIFLIVENYSGTLKLSSAVVKEVLFMLWKKYDFKHRNNFFSIKEEAEWNLSC